MKYEFLPILKEEEKYISTTEMLKRAKELNAEGTKEDCDYLLAHPEELEQEKNNSVACVYWDGGRWVQVWFWLDRGWGIELLK